MSLATVYCTFPDADTAARIARAMLEARLAACANILPPCRSLFRWRGAIEDATEVPVIFKSTAAAAERLTAAIAAAHPYETPAIETWPASGAHPPFADWVSAEVC